MLPAIAIVGRPNVGKSTLFNQLTRSRDALVADVPGLTRDRQYGITTAGGRRILVVDTGGLSDTPTELSQLAERQTLYAVAEADATLLVVDAAAGLTAADEIIAAELRSAGKPILLVANKTEGLNKALATAEFHGLGLGQAWPIAAAFGQGIKPLLAAALDAMPDRCNQAEDRPTPPGIKVAVVGRPNVGKSTLINRILGEERVIAHHAPGTTRDSIYVPFTRGGTPYTLIDTAGIRRRSKVLDRIEKFSVVKTLRTIESAEVVVFLIDAQEGITEQDITLIGLVIEAGRALVIGINKWDGLDAEQRRRVRAALERRSAFVAFARRHVISALHGTGVPGLFPLVNEAWRCASRQLTTPTLTRLLSEAVARNPPPVVRGRRVKLRYAHQGGRNPPTIIIHGNQTASVPETYRRYLAKFFRETLKLEGTPVRIELRTADNPYKGRTNVLTARQRRKRRRLMRYAKERDKR